MVCDPQCGMQQTSCFCTPNKIRSVNAVLTKPLVGVRPHSTEVMPTGAVVEFSSDAHNGQIDVAWKGRYFSVCRQDLLDACSVNDVARIAFAWASVSVLSRSGSARHLHHR
jgi:hypothetical protein